MIRGAYADLPARGNFRLLALPGPAPEPGHALSAPGHTPGPGQAARRRPRTLWSCPALGHAGAGGTRHGKTLALPSFGGSSLGGFRAVTGQRSAPRVSFAVDAFLSPEILDWKVFIYLSF